MAFKRPKNQEDYRKENFIVLVLIIVLVIITVLVIRKIAKISIDGTYGQIQINYGNSLLL